MCYDISYMTKRAEKYAQHYNIEAKKFKSVTASSIPTFHVQGFAHPDIPVITNALPNEIQFFQWGLIPFWVKDVAQSFKISNQTLNARGETIFEKPAFRQSAKNKRCLIVVDGFFEHHWHNGKSYPYFIRMKDESPFSLGGLWENWELKDQNIERNTVSIITTDANPLMGRIHNNPKSSVTHRMPFIVPNELEDQWLQAESDPVGVKELQEMIMPYDESELEAFAVPRLRGKSYPGNVPETQQHFTYKEFDTNSILTD